MLGRTEIRFSRPAPRIFTMLLFLGAVGAVCGYLYADIRTVFLANPQLNGLIAVVFIIGVLTAFWQVIRLFSAVNWLEALAARTRGIESIQPPGLLVAMDPMRKTGAKQAIGSGAARSILDSVASRIDESRDLLRYISGLLIFLGLLGTFWGLAKTVPAVVDTIRAVAPQEGEDSVVVFERLMVGLEAQLGGMGVAFASSLLGLAGSLIVGFLELMTAGAHNRFYGELEAWLSAMTRITSMGDGEHSAPDAVSSDLVEQIAFNTQQLEALARLMFEGEQRRSTEVSQMVEAVRGIDAIAEQSIDDRRVLGEATEAQVRVAHALERLVGLQGASSGVSFGAADAQGGAGFDSETRQHIRNIDLLLARMLEESAADRVETAESLRREVRAVGRAVVKVGDALGHDVTSGS